MENVTITVRKATKNDLPDIHQLVRELAIYERAEDAFTATLEDYGDDYAQGIFQAFVAEVEGKIAGMALNYMSYSTWKGKMLFLEDFVVNGQYRRYGIGQKLFEAYLEEARKLGCRVAKWQVLDWNEPAVAFYQKNNAIIEKEWWNGKIFL